MSQENLLVDVQDPLRPYTSPEGVRGEALSGQVYQDAYQRLVTNPQRQLFVPIIQWIDRTSVTGNDRFSLKPYMLLLPYLLSHFDTPFQHGDIMVFAKTENFIGAKSNIQTW